jgi:hypothetical protein
MEDICMSVTEQPERARRATIKLRFMISPSEAYASKI